MRTDQEMLELILRTVKKLQVDAVALSGSRTDTKAPKDEFQDYDLVYVVDNLRLSNERHFLVGPVWQTYHRARGYSRTSPSLSHTF